MTQVDIGSSAVDRGPERELKEALEKIRFSWETPIEDELLNWVRYMKQSNQTYIHRTIWGKKQKREAEIYATVFGMVEKRIIMEKEIRNA